MAASREQCRFEQTSFLYGTNATFIAELYAPLSGRSEFGRCELAGFFADLADQTPAILKELAGPTGRPSAAA